MTEALSTDHVVIDSSALVAMLLGEPEADALTTSLLKHAERWMSAFSLLETSVVVSARKGLEGRVALDALCQQIRLVIVPVTHDHAMIAREAWLRFGKGRHPAGLNLGDCCSYALSKHSGFPLLCKGDDFPRTDLQLVGY